MYEYVRGAVTWRGDGAVALDVGGIGYRLAVSASTLQRLPASGEAKLFVHMLVREERQELFGFASQAERHLFRQLLQVSGVGPAVAMALLSAHEAELLATHIASGDLGLLTRVKGVGKRTGERILVELRDKFVKAGGGRAATGAIAGSRQSDAVLALCSLGMARVEAERRVASVGSTDLALDEIVKRALRSAP